MKYTRRNPLVNTVDARKEACRSIISMVEDLEEEDRHTVADPPPSESAAFKDLGELSSPESRLHMLYVPNARGGSRSWTGRVETWLEGSYRNRTARIEDRNPVRGSDSFPFPPLLLLLWISSSILFFFFFFFPISFRSNWIILQEFPFFFFFYQNWKGERKRSMHEIVRFGSFYDRGYFYLGKKFQALFSREWICTILKIWRGGFVVCEWKGEKYERMFSFSWIFSNESF